MATRKLSVIASPVKRSQLMQLARLFKSAGQGEQSLSHPKDARAGAELENCVVYGVRDAKNAFSTLLNGASKGDAAFIEGRGGTLLLVDTEALADVLTAQTETAHPTFGAALKELPYQPTDLEAFELEGHYPEFGFIGGAL